MNLTAITLFLQLLTTLLTISPTQQTLAFAAQALQTAQQELNKIAVQNSIRVVCPSAQSNCVLLQPTSTIPGQFGQEYQDWLKRMYPINPVDPRGVVVPHSSSTST